MNKNILMKQFFKFYTGFFGANNFFSYIFYISLNTYDVMFHSPELNSKYSFQLRFKNETILRITLVLFL